MSVASEKKPKSSKSTEASKSPAGAKKSKGAASAKGKSSAGAKKSKAGTGAKGKSSAAAEKSKAGTGTKGKSSAAAKKSKAGTGTKGKSSGAAEKSKAGTKGKSSAGAKSGKVDPSRVLEKLLRKRKKRGLGRTLEDFERLCDGLSMVNPRAAGIDIASGEHWVCVPRGTDDDHVRRFEAYTRDLYAIRDWLLANKIETVAMESTGVYWIPLYGILEEAGLECYLVNARDMKSVKGRPKTDRLDSEWLQRLHSYGLLRGSFQPESEIREMRDIWRMRSQLDRDASRCVQRMQKALHTMNVLLPKVVSDITGVTGMSIIRAIVRGETSPEELARLRNPRVQRPHSEFVEALRGEYRPEQVFLLGKFVEQYDFLQSQMYEYDAEIEKYAAKLEKAALELTDAQRETHEKASQRSRTKYKKAPRFNVHSWAHGATGVDLTRLPGFDSIAVLGVLLEVGIDLSAWKTVGEFCSWLGLCPLDKKSAGKNLGSRTKKCKNRAAGYFRMAASTLRNSRNPLGTFFRRMQLRHDTAHAITATAHKLAKIFFLMVTRGTEYREPDMETYRAQLREREIRRLEKRARRLGYSLQAQEV